MKSQLKKNNSSPAGSTASGAVFSSLGHAAPRGLFGMLKNPAVLFYADNFFSGTMFFTDEQVGKYMRALCAQITHGHLTEEQLDSFLKGDTTVKAKFDQDENGLYYNERMRIEIVKRNKFTESRRNNIKKRYGYTSVPTSEDTSEDTYGSTTLNMNINMNSGIHEGGVGGDPEHENRKSDIEHIINFLNEKCGTSFKCNTQSTIRHITARLREKYTLSDFELVISHKYSEWGKKPDMKQYLRPETLFGTKFEGYLMAAKSPVKNKTPRIYC